MNDKISGLSETMRVAQIEQINDTFTKINAPFSIVIKEFKNGNKTFIYKKAVGDELKTISENLLNDYLKDKCGVGLNLIKKDSTAAIEKANKFYTKNPSKLPINNYQLPITRKPVELPVIVLDPVIKEEKIEIPKNFMKNATQKEREQKLIEIAKKVDSEPHGIHTTRNYEAEEIYKNNTKEYFKNQYLNNFISFEKTLTDKNLTRFKNKRNGEGLKKYKDTQDRIKSNIEDAKLMLKNNYDDLNENIKENIDHLIEANYPNYPKELSINPQEKPQIIEKKADKIIPTSINKEVRKTQIKFGNKTTIITPSEKLDGNYALMELNSLIPSNNPFTFSPNPEYPYQCQTRDYKEDKAEQLKVLEYSSHFEPSHLINSSPDATTGPPICTQNGIVLGGNGRTMILKRLNTENYNKYKNLLINTFYSYGFKEADIRSFKNPVLVRIVEINIDQCVKYSNILNKSNAQEYDEVREGIAYAAQLENSHNAFENIAKIFENSEGETFNQVIDDNNSSKKIISLLERLGIINKTNRSVLTNENKFTSRGKDMLENMLLAAILPDKKLISTARSYTLKILKALPSLIRIKHYSKEWNLLDYLQNAIKFEGKRRASGLKFKDFILQNSAFDETPDAMTVEVWKVLENSGINQFKDFLKYYCDRVDEQTSSSNMFGGSTTAIDLIAKWLNAKGLGDIKPDREPMVENYARMIFAPEVVHVSFQGEIINVFDDEGHIIGQIDLFRSKLIKNQYDIFTGEVETDPYIPQMTALFKYVKSVNTFKPVDRNQTSMFGLSKKTSRDIKSISGIEPNWLNIDGVPKDLLSRLSRPFDILIWGLPGQGKSTLALLFAETLAKNGNVLYFCTEEKISDGLITERVRSNKIGSEHIFFNDEGEFWNLVDELNTGKYDFVILDSINKLGKKEAELGTLMLEFPEVSFIFVAHSEKQGRYFIGARELSYLVDAKIKVTEGIAQVEKNRFGPAFKTVNLFEKPSQFKYRKENKYSFERVYS